jgi:hypothetical protein
MEATSSPGESKGCIEWHAAQITSVQPPCTYHLGVELEAVDRLKDLLGKGLHVERVLGLRQDLNELVIGQEEEAAQKSTQADTWVPEMVNKQKDGTLMLACGRSWYAPCQIGNSNCVVTTLLPA